MRISEIDTSGNKNIQRLRNRLNRFKLVRYKKFSTLFYPLHRDINIYGLAVFPYYYNFRHYIHPTSISPIIVQWCNRGTPKLSNIIRGIKYEHYTPF